VRRRPVSNDDASRRLADELLVREYENLRQETFRAYEYAQGVVRFVVASYAAIFAAALVAVQAASDAAPSRTFLGYAALATLGIVLPGLVFVGALSWLGELIRAERAGAYLRGLEAELAGRPEMRSSLGLPPLRWESLIMRSRASRGPMGKQAVSYFGVASLFAGGVLFAFAFALMWHREMLSWEPAPDWEVWVWTCAPGALVVGFFFGCARLGIRLKNLGRYSATASAEE
jgi:hypothetical protein